MPNWNTNCLVVRGTTSSLCEFARTNVTGDKTIVADALLAASITAEGLADSSAVDKIAEQVLASFSNDESLFSLGGIAPEPAWGRDSDAWYDWRIQNWGVKWGASSTSVQVRRHEDGQLELMYEFETPWGPPHVWFHRLAPHFPDLDIEMWWNEEQAIGGVFLSPAGTATVFEQDVETFDGAPEGWNPPYGLQEFWEDEA